MNFDLGGRVETTGCPECKLFSLELVDPNFIYQGRVLTKWCCSECGYEVIRL